MIVSMPLLNIVLMCFRKAIGAKVKFTTATALVQLLQQAKAQFQLQTLLLRLDRYDLLVVDDIGWEW